MRELSKLPLNHCLVGYHPKNGKKVSDAAWDWKLVKLYRHGRISTILNKNTRPAMHGCGLGRIREGVVPSRPNHYAPPQTPIPHWVPPMKPALPSYIEACTMPSDTVNPFNILGPRFISVRSGLAQAHLSRPHLTLAIAKHLVFLEHVFTKQYKTFRDLPSGQGGQVGRGGFLYHSKPLSSNSAFEKQLLSLLPEEIRFDPSSSVALCRVMRTGHTIKPHCDDSSYGPAVIFVPLQPPDNDPSLSPLIFTKGKEVFQLQCDPTKISCFFGSLRQKFQHCVQTIPKVHTPRITVTFRLWNNCNKQWLNM